jgi:hypothetical protein
VERTNKEGLTFKEWVCAAGVAVIDDGAGGVRPYSESWTEYPLSGETRVLRPDDVVSRRKPKRVKKVWYSKKIRAAWLAGEDPSEYRRDV